MTILLPAPERQLKTLTAETNVNVDYVTPEHERIQATGERGFYTADTGLIRMSGQPTWRTGQREGTATSWYSIGLTESSGSTATPD